MTNRIHFFKHKTNFFIKDKNKLIQWLKEVIEKKERIEGEINFIITNDKILHEINLKYLNTDTLTDIITFTLSEEKEANDVR